MEWSLIPPKYWVHAVVAAYLALWVSGFFRPSPLPRNFDRIVEGMSEKEVMAILGNPQPKICVEYIVREEVGKKSVIEIWIKKQWKTADWAIWVSFDERGMVKNIFLDEPEDFHSTFCRWLGF